MSLFEFKTLQSFLNCKTSQSFCRLRLLLGFFIFWSNFLKRWLGFFEKILDLNFESDLPFLNNFILRPPSVSSFFLKNLTFCLAFSPFC